MATWIKAPSGGTCCDCQASVCANCCPCGMSEAGGDFGFDETCPVSGVAFSIAVSFNESTSVASQMRIYADGVIKYDSGCITGSASGTAVIPVGTANVRVEVFADCHSTGLFPSWTFSTSCTF